jgi:hypothetical protein
MTAAGRISLRRTISPLLAPLALMALSSPTLATKGKGKGKHGSAEITACVTNYKSGLEQERSGHLLEARELFIRCSKSACGSPLREECTTRFTQLSVDIPSVVPVVTSAAGKPVLDVEVQVDGQRLTTSLDGHSFIMNPGAHDFSFSKDGHIFATQSLMIVQGQRNRLIAASLVSPQAAPPIAAVPDGDNPEKAASPPRAAVDLTPPSAEKETVAKAAGADLTARPEPSARSRIPTLSFVTAGAGVAALGAGALLTYWGRKDTSLLDSCSPGCPQSSADHIHNLYLAADISIGFGIAALAGSYWAYAHSRSSHDEGGDEVAVRSTPTLLLAPTPSGAVGALSGTF